MKPFILFLALEGAVGNFLALARKFEFGNVIASLTFLLCFCLQEPSFAFFFNFNNKEITFLHLKVFDFSLRINTFAKTLDAILVISPIGGLLEVKKQAVEVLFLVNSPQSTLIE